MVDEAWWEFGHDLQLQPLDEVISSASSPSAVPISLRQALRRDGRRASRSSLASPGWRRFRGMLAGGVWFVTGFTALGAGYAVRETLFPNLGPTTARSVWENPAPPLDDGAPAVVADGAQHSVVPDSIAVPPIVTTGEVQPGAVEALSETPDSSPTSSKPSSVPSRSRGANTARHTPVRSPVDRGTTVPATTPPTTVSSSSGGDSDDSGSGDGDHGGDQNGNGGSSGGGGH